MTVVDDLKRAAAEYALTFVREGMILGLGSGSTAHEFVRLLGQKKVRGVKAIATSKSTANLASEVGINLIAWGRKFPRMIDLTVDGADELTKDLTLVKGGGGDLLRERIVAASSKEVLIIAEERKLVKTLGAFPLPVEVVKFGFLETVNRIAGMTAKILDRAIGDEDMVLRKKKNNQREKFVTDQKNFICDCHFKAIPKPEEMYKSLAITPGVVDSGLFVGVASRAVLAGEGGVRVLDAS